MSRPGWGERHPDVAALLERCRPVAVYEDQWPGSGPLRAGAHVGAEVLPPDVVTSVRVLVVVDDSLVVCTNAGGTHPWPGGRLEPGETFVDAAVREVHEETGWHLERGSVRVLGWLHIENLEPRPPEHPFPHPDFLQYVVTARATTRDGDGDTWADVAGYEESSRVVPLVEGRTMTFQDPLSAPFLALL